MEARRSETGLRPLMRNRLRRLLVGISVLGIGSGAWSAEDPAGPAHPPNLAYEASVEHPFGKIHPDAHPRVREFEFLVGDHDCVEERLSSDGTSQKRRCRWKAAFILNGQAIQDWAWNSAMAATSIRFFDDQRDTWRVNYQAKPGNIFGYVYEGGKVGDEIVLTTTYTNAQGDEIFNRLIYHDITKEGFSWRSEETNQTTGETFVDWKVRAVRRQ